MHVIYGVAKGVHANPFGVIEEEKNTKKMPE